MSTECIHGLEPSACDLCSPRRSEPAPRTRRTAPRSTPASRPGRPADVAVRATPARRYLVVHRDRLAALLADGPLDDDAGWRAELGEHGAFDPIRWPDARSAERGTELVVLVGAGPDPDHLELVGVANQPTRTVVVDVLAAAGRRPRVVLNPAWFS